MMKNLALLTASAILSLLVIGCDSPSPATTRPGPYAAYHPTSGQNLAPGLAPYAHGDPEWPMDAGRDGGGGGKR